MISLRPAPLRLLLAGASALVIAVAATACGDEEEESANAEEITIYSGREEELVAPLFDRYEKETGTEIEVRYGDSAELAATILEEGENSPADVFFSQDAGSLGAVEKEGLLSELPEDVLGVVDERYSSPDGQWVGTSGRARVLAYNTESVSDSGLPASVLDLTDPEWEGRVGWAPTNGSFQAFVTAMRLTEGEDATRDWLEGMVSNDTEAYADNEAVRDAIDAGEIDAGLINHYYVAQAQEEEGKGYPVDVHFFEDEDVGSLVNVAGVGVLASSDASQGATEFAEFLLDDSSQEFFSAETKEYPLVEGVDADPLVVPLEQIPQPDVDLSNLDDLKGTLTLIEESGAL